MGAMQKVSRRRMGLLGRRTCGVSVGRFSACLIFSDDCHEVSCNFLGHVFILIIIPQRCASVMGDEMHEEGYKGNPSACQLELNDTASIQCECSMVDNVTVFALREIRNWVLQIVIPVQDPKLIKATNIHFRAVCENRTRIMPPSDKMISCGSYGHRVGFRPGEVGVYRTRDRE